MGNVPTKEARSRSSSVGGGSPSNTLTRSSRRHTTSSILENAGFLMYPSGTSSSSSHGKSSRSAEEKLKQKEAHMMNLIIRYEENVDGGFLAPHGIYKSNLDFNTEIVRSLIVERRIAPFFTPLQDFDEDWTDEEVATIASQSPLHAIDEAYSDDEEPDDADNHKIHLSANYFRRQEQKKKVKELTVSMKELQKQHEMEYMAAKQSQKQDPNVPSKELLLKLYRHSAECPICFLYFPPYLNVSRCCGQPICSECFVQIRRLDPHPPHDDVSNENSAEIPHTLISEYANCPFCAMPNFGVTYDPPKDLSVGIGGITSPAYYKGPLAATEEAVVSSSDEVSAASPQSPGTPVSRTVSPTKAKARKRRSSVPADDAGVITTDYIRPDWEQKLASAKSKLARRAATASAIHASNLIVDDEGSSRGQSSSDSQNLRYLQSIEDRMIEEAMRLSLAEEKARRKKQEREK
ncbi:hypothetical protein CJJ07_003079 [Candidozyma auris]|nr:hypothetical protein CJJ07_003079 [[Candida] auris]